MTASWSVALLLSEINRPSGESGIVSYLRLATLGEMNFPLNDSDVMTFTVPSRSYQSALVVPFASDILLWRADDDDADVTLAVQRFRVVGRTIGWATTTFSAASYREVLAGRIFHDSDHLDYPTSFSGTMEQSAVGWALIQQEQAKPAGNLGISLGDTPSTAVQVAAYIVDVSGNTTPQHFFTIGEPVGPAIQAKLAGVSPGFEWDIIPDAASPTTKLRYSSWNVRGQVSDLVLSEATIDPSSTLSQLASDYANVFRGEGGSSVVDGATLPGVVVYVPSTGNPDGTEAIPTGRWEKAIASTDVQTSAQVGAWAAKQAEIAKEIDTWSITLRSDVWKGPSQLWKGDTVRLLLEFPTFYEDGSPADALLSVDASLRVLGLTIRFSSSGAEQVTLTLNHPTTKFADGPIPAQLGARLARLERRS